MSDKPTIEHEREIIAKFQELKLELFDLAWLHDSKKALEEMVECANYFATFLSYPDEPAPFNEKCPKASILEVASVSTRWPVSLPGGEQKNNLLYGAQIVNRIGVSSCLFQLKLSPQEKVAEIIKTVIDRTKENMEIAEKQNRNWPRNGSVAMDAFEESVRKVKALKEETLDEWVELGMLWAEANADLKNDERWSIERMPFLAEASTAIQGRKKTKPFSNDHTELRDWFKRKLTEGFKKIIKAYDS